MLANHFPNLLLRALIFVLLNRLRISLSETFGAHHKNVNKNRPHTLAAKLQANDASFYRYKVYADIRGGSVGRGRQTTVGLSRTAIFSVAAARWQFFSETLEMRPALL